MAGQSRSSNIAVDDAAFIAGLKAAVADLEIQSAVQLVRMGIDIQNRAKSLTPVDTGRLRSSISHKKGADARGPYVDVGSNVEYAPYVEFGTSRQKPQPYLRPALAEAVSAFSGGKYKPMLKSSYGRAA